MDRPIDLTTTLNRLPNRIIEAINVVQPTFAILESWVNEMEKSNAFLYQLLSGEINTYYEQSNSDIISDLSNCSRVECNYKRKPMVFERTMTICLLLDIDEVGP